MGKLSVLNIKGEKTSDISLNKELWGIEPNDAVLYDAITLSRNSLRQGTASTKTRSEVSGGGRKPWRQKGTGRARQGSIRAAQWYHGGVVFGPHPRDYDKKMNRKERLEFLKNAVDIRYKYSNLFNSGKLLRPPVITTDVLPIESAGIVMNQIQAGLWQTADSSKRVLFIINVSKNEANAKIEYDDKVIELTLKPYEFYVKEN